MKDTGHAEPRASLLPTIHRERLLGEVRTANPQVVKLIAPAGYGKTTLAAALAKPHELVARCDCLHVSSPIDLVRSVLEAIVNALPERDGLGISMHLSR